MLRDLLLTVLSKNWQCPGMSIGLTSFVKVDHGQDIKTFFNSKVDTSDTLLNEGQSLVVCDRCRGKKIDIDDWDSHQDWHFAVDLQRSERQQLMQEQLSDIPQDHSNKKVNVKKSSKRSLGSDATNATKRQKGVQDYFKTRPS